MSNSYDDKIIIKGARVHNLKGVDVEIPHGKLVVVTGLSGSGKSTLAFDTIFAEGQRRYVESLSSYARQFLGRVNKPDADMISGIAPAIAIEQRVSNNNPRSTVGTTTEIYDYMRLLYSRAGHTYSPISDEEVTVDSIESIVDTIVARGEGSERVVRNAYITSPLNSDGGDGGDLLERLLNLMEQGVESLYIGCEIVDITLFASTVSEKSIVDNVEVIFEKVHLEGMSAMNAEVQSELKIRLSSSISKAYEYSKGICGVILEDAEGGRDYLKFSSRYERDGMTFEEPSAHLFSFNSPLGACTVCEGYGKVVGIDENLVVPDKSRSIYDNAIACWRGEKMSEWRDQLVKSAYLFDFPIHVPYYELTRSQRRLLWSGNKYFHGLNSFFDYLESQRHKIQYRVMKARYTGKTTCNECGGSRLRREALYVKVGGASIADLIQMPVDELFAFFDGLTLDKYDMQKAARIVIEIRNRLQYMIDVGLGYLTLDRVSSSLSGGESQRINLSSSLGNNLTGSLYILDEPSIGLHPRDTERLIGVVKQLRDLGNTVIVVEHEVEVIRSADYIIDVGPEAGYLGGEIVYSGDYEGLLRCEGSLTADYLTGRKRIDMPKSLRAASGVLKVVGARENNLKCVDVNIPLGVMSCITGVSGSGKSSLVRGVLYPALKRALNDSGVKAGDFDGLSGDIDKLSSVEMIDQSPIGRSSRSNPVTYLKAYDDIRRLYADLPYSRNVGLSASSFSFNIAGGRCDECQGEGVIKVSMQFMADIELTCESCNGSRFKGMVLDARYRSHSICDILEMTVDRAIEFFSEDNMNSDARKIVARLLHLQSVGLGYIKLGQSSSTLSGGEAQRVKLASFLAKDKEGSSKTERIMFIFDEPTTGLHFHDIKRLLKAFDALIDRGHTVVVVEHNMDVVKCADHLIDIGPEAGEKGGKVVFTGEPREIMKLKDNWTAKYLAEHEANSAK